MSDPRWYTWSPQSKQLPHAKEPLSSRSLGTPERESLGLFLQLNAANALERHLATDPDKIGGGIIVGQVYEDERPFIIIQGAIGFPGKGAALDDFFSDQAWEFYRQRCEQTHPNTVVLGWFCSNPHQDVSLSAAHRGIHERFFTQRWQVALVADLTNNVSQFYRWNGSSLAKMSGFSVVSEADSTEEAAPTAELSLDLDETEPVQNRPRRRSSGKLLSGLLLACCAALLMWPAFPFSAPALWHKMADKQAELEALQRDLASLNEPEASAGNAPAVLPASPQKQLPVSNPPGTEVQQSLPDSPTAPTTESNQTVPAIPSNQEINEAVPEITLTEKTNPQGLKSEQYIVKPGDNLWNISEEFLGSPWDYGALAEKNGISDPGLIFPGTQLVLPPNE